MLTYTYSHTIVENNCSQEQHLFARTVGLKQYELTDHLGNVRATVSDKLLDIDATQGQVAERSPLDLQLESFNFITIKS